VQKLPAQSGKNRNVFVALSGQVSPRLRQELEARGLTVHDRLAARSAEGICASGLDGCNILPGDFASELL
jgi:hypothetical protein